MWYIYAMEYYAALKKERNPFPYYKEDDHYGGHHVK
jgi:hypothetical protein